MKRSVFPSVAVALLLTALPGARAPAQDGSPQQARLKSDVMRLASPEYRGRRGADAYRAGEYLIARFRELKLEPLFGDSFGQSIPAPGGAGIIGRNVGAVLRGSDERLRDEYVILSAHFDHLGTRGGVMYPGADDNASGVAMMLEVARSVATGQVRPRRSLVLIGFDLEEDGLFGSRFFVEHTPIPLAKVRLFLTADMIGRSLGGVCDGYVFVMGTEHAPPLRSWLDDAQRGEAVKVGTLGSDLLLLDRSDYGPFRARKVPFLFFSTGENPTYHTPTDTPDTIDYSRLTGITRIIERVVRKALSEDEVPAWTPVSAPAMAEAMTIRDVLRILLAHRDDLQIGVANSLLMRNALRTLDTIAARGSITPEERTGVMRVARVVLMTVF